MIWSWGIVMEVFRVVSGQGNNEEGENVLNVRIWGEGAVLEYELRCAAKTPGSILTTYRNVGGVLRCRYKVKYCVGNSMRKKFEGGRCKEGC